VSGTLLLAGKKIGGGSGRANAAGTATVKLKLTSKAKRRFKRLKRASVQLRLTVNGANAGSKTLKLKR
jgi:hypothetical protein